MMESGPATQPGPGWIEQSGYRSIATRRLRLSRKDLTGAHSSESSHGRSIGVYPADTAAHLAPDLRKLPLPSLEQVIPARLIAAVSDKAGRRIPCWHPSALQSLGNLTKAP